MKKRKIYSECVNAKIARNQSGKRWQAVFVYALDVHGIKGYELKKHFFMPGGEVDKAHPFVSACVKKAGELLDREEEPMPFGASCEQCFLVEAGAATVIIGPGSLDQAHTVDEYVEKAQLLRAAELYRQIAMDILK